MRVMSFNIRTQTQDDGPDQWIFRRDDVGRMLSHSKPDVIGFQEAGKLQMDNLIERLPDYDWAGVGREDGKEAGEFSPVFWRRERFEKLDASTFWIAPDCTKPGKGWDAACTRVATWAALRDRTTGREWLALNTHLDHMGEQARTEGAKLIAGRLAGIAKGRPMVITGDFNAGPETPAYAAMLAAGLADARVTAAERAGPLETFTSWKKWNKVPRLIDYIFVSPVVTVSRHEVLSEDFAGRQISDHRALFADLD
jgi:endonuclease/exonuclease/phosphatase family metal-dependent hydrolase